MKTLSTLLLFLATLFCYSQIKETATVDSIIKTNDLSHLWSSDSLFFGENNATVPRWEPFGYIGENFQRLRIHFISVIKNQEKPNEYYVYGKTKVKNNICEFQGILNITKFSISAADSNIYYSSNYKIGIITGEYSFYENSESSGSGALVGTFETRVCFEKLDSIYYDWYALGADGYRNNQFEGTWKSYKTEDLKVCNWGDYRIPKSQLLDWGYAEFSPKPKYYKYGWDFYEKVETEKDKSKITNVVKEEFSKWWKK